MTKFNGWPNRETWAAYLWLTNDAGLYQEAMEIVRAPFRGEGRYALGPHDREAIPLLEDDLANMFDALFDFDTMNRDLYRIREDIGSLWRVNWREIVEHLIEDSVEWSDAASAARSTRWRASMKYVSYYIESTGQPVTDRQGHTSKRAAITRARALRSSLVLRSGGTAVAEVVSTGEPTSDPLLLYVWHEHAEGGYRTA